MSKTVRAIYWSDIDCGVDAAIIVLKRDGKPIAWRNYNDLQCQNEVDDFFGWVRRIAELWAELEDATLLPPISEFDQEFNDEKLYISLLELIKRQ